MEKQSIPKRSLASRAGLLGGTLTPGVPDGADDLEAYQIGMGEREPGELSDGRRSDTAPALGRAHPVPQVCESMDRIDLVQIAAPEKAAGRVDDHEAVLEAARTFASSME